MMTRRSSSRPQRPGITLLETLAALSLASLLLSLLFLVLDSLIDSQARVDGSGANSRSELARSMIASDLMTSRSIDIDPEAIVFHGFAGRDPATGLPNAALTATEYQVVDLGSERQLVRQQYQTVDGQVTLLDSRVLGSGITEVHLQVPTSDSAGWRNLVDRTQRIEGLLVPGRLRFCLHRESGLPLFVVVVRPGEDQ